MRRTSPARPFATTLAVTALALSAGCGGSGGPATGGTAGRPDRITVGVIAIVDVAPIYLGRAKGFFSKRNIDMTLQAGSGGSASISGVVSGQFQFAFANITSLLVARDKGLPLKVLANGNASTGVAGKDFGAVVVKAGSPIRSPRDLAGHTVSVNNLKNILDTTIRASVRKDGGDPSRIKFVELAFPDAPAAVLGGKVDAAGVVEPFLTTAISQGARPVSWCLVDTAPNLTIAAYFTREQTATSNPDLTKRFTDAINESLAYARAHPDEARDVVKTYTKIPADVLTKITLPAWPNDLNRDSISTLARLAQQDGLISKPADLTALLP
ncbi:MAG TPA: ABC transporter substrate-binding protein [Rugosimonospora sp.]|nr:ABC transporter substrate-binding protein [Rugosimonospora sp.]